MSDNEKTSSLTFFYILIQNWLFFRLPGVPTFEEEHRYWIIYKDMRVFLKQRNVILCYPIHINCKSVILKNQKSHNNVFFFKNERVSQYSLIINFFSNFLKIVSIVFSNCKTSIICPWKIWNKILKLNIKLTFFVYSRAMSLRSYYSKTKDWKMSLLVFLNN